MYGSGSAVTSVFHATVSCLKVARAAFRAIVQGKTADDLAEEVKDTRR